MLFTSWLDLSLGYKYDFLLISQVIHCWTDDHDESVKSSYFNLPPLDVSIAFPQATPASIFPPCGKNSYIV